MNLIFYLILIFGLDHRIGSSGYLPSYVGVDFIDSLVGNFVDLGNSVVEVDTVVVIVEVGNLGLNHIPVLDNVVIIGTSLVVAITNVIVTVIDQAAYMARSCPS